MVTDDKGATHTDTVVITITKKVIVNPPPKANAGADQTLEEGKPVTLTGTATDDGKVVSFLWKEGTKEKGKTKTLTLENLAVGKHTYTLMVTDDKGATHSDDVIITVTKKAVVAKAQVIKVLGCDTVAVGQEVVCTLEYSTTDGVTKTTGFGFNLFFDSSKLQFVSLDKVFKFGKTAVNKTPNEDKDNKDNDPKTTQTQGFAWSSSDGDWPDEDKANLAIVRFKATGSVATSTTLNFTKKDTAAGYGFSAVSHTINITK